MRFLNKIFIAIGLILAGNAAYADILMTGCGDYGQISNIPTPIEQNVKEIEVDGYSFKIRLVLDFGGEPVNAGAWLAIQLIHPEDTESNACFLLHNGEEVANHNEAEGFNYVLVSNTIVRENETLSILELFIPVSEYPYAMDEDHFIRLIEINVDKAGIPKIIDGWQHRK